MLGNIYQSIINTSNVLWEPVGVFFSMSLLWCIWRWRKNLRDPLPWCVVFGMLFAIVWRLRFKITEGRYYSLAIVPVLYLSFFALWDVCKRRHLRYFLLAVVCAICLGRILYSNSAERDVMAFYRKVHDDATVFSRTAGVSYTKHSQQEAFYTGVDVVSSAYLAPADVVLKQLDGNLKVWDGERDAVYIFLALARGMTIPEQWLADNKVTSLGETWYDRRHRKRLAVLKYLPSPTMDVERVGELMPNGDFQAVLSESDNRKNIQRLGRRAPRLLQPGIILPQRWGIYHSLIVKSDSVATVVRHDEKSALHLEARGGYIATYSPGFQVNVPRKLGFDVYAETDAELELIREIKFKGGGGAMYLILSLKFAPGTRRRYIITLPPFERDIKSGVWFWLKSGTIELSDIRLQ